jgi:hypothetical protein
MSNAPVINIKVVRAAEICTRFDLNKEARPLLHNEMGSSEFVAALAANSQYLAGIDFIAHALSAREAVWWGCLCLQQACGSRLSPQEKTACKAAVQWILEPVEANRAAAKEPADALGPGSPAGALAAAVNKTEGDLAPGLAPMPHGPFAPAKAVARAVKLASVKVDPIKVADTQRLFMELGVGVAEGRFVWAGIRSGAPVRRLE